MSLIRVYHRETDGESFPPLCMRCGADSDRMVSQTFSWMSGWVHVLLLVGLLPWLIGALITRKTARMTLPLCARHVNHWLYRTLYVFLGLFFWIAMAVLLIAFSKEIPDQLREPAIAACVFGALFWLIGGLILTTSAIRAAVINDFGVKLTNVNKDFAKAWEMRCEIVDEKARRRKKRTVWKEEDEDDD